MSVTAKDVQHVARLAELAVADADLPALTAQMDRIVSFVAQLPELPDSEAAGSFLAGPAQTPLRPDEVRPGGLARPPESFAPEFVDGFFVVPKLGAMEEP
jgi:aspartyl-tRNA(Asn)/glutamyl-tRNA(Gln) amidotransferase subunit C